MLNHLGSIPESQITHIRTLDVGTDELLLEFDDVMNTAKARRFDESLSEEDFNLLQKIDSAADAVACAGAEIWSEESLRSAPEWEELRKVARFARCTLAKSWDISNDPR
ncbi:MULTISPECIES: hypothetical protein [Streptomyces]|uniref:hypothetical protein n=1 Tax=Streptomyces TaxID=1883 RepID=UPI00131ECD21|nr:MULTISPECIES: hypothetical protein [Streptomyces]MCI4081635.1 hypothetical protein [Streptomyces sp. MMS21 TC-5]